jgi:hypothetical protein
MLYFSEPARALGAQRSRLYLVTQASGIPTGGFFDRYGRLPC